MANSFEESPLFELLTLEAATGLPPQLPQRAGPHYWGHRERLRNRFREAGADALPDYEIMELVLFRAIPRRDVKPLAKTIIERFGSFAEAASAAPERLAEVPGVSEAVVTEIKLVHAAGLRCARGQIMKRPLFGSIASLVEYLRSAMAFEMREQFRILFLDKRNRLIVDEVQQRGTVDHTPVYVREVLRRAIELSATAIVLVHNHPSGDPTPSQADITMTKEVDDAAAAIGIIVHDHLIIGRDGHLSMKQAGIFKPSRLT